RRSPQPLPPRAWLRGALPPLPAGLDHPLRFWRRLLPRRTAVKSVGRAHEGGARRGRGAAGAAVAQERRQARRRASSRRGRSGDGGAVGEGVLRRGARAPEELPGLPGAARRPRESQGLFKRLAPFR
ncbi:unnamed protein product, partial [Prorocentrum cordatum]